MIISVDSGKNRTFDKTQYPFKVKNTHKIKQTRNKGNFLNMKQIYETPTTNITLSDER